MENFQETNLSIQENHENHENQENQEKYEEVNVEVKEEVKVEVKEDVKENDVVVEIKSKKSKKSTQRNSDDTVLIFKSISDFVFDLADMYADKYKPLKLYRRLLKQISITDTVIITRHIDTFKTFLWKNKEFVLAKDVKSIDVPIIQFSPRIYINLDTVMNFDKDDEVHSAIWAHLINIFCRLFPDNASEALVALHSVNETNETNGDINSMNNSMNNSVSNCIVDIAKKMEKNIKADSKPEEIISSLLSSGEFMKDISGVVSQIQSGKLDIKQLMGSVSSIVGNDMGGGGMPDLSSLLGNFGM
jgi:hypothetical protein